MAKLRILCIGDVVGDPGCSILQKHLGAIRKEHDIQAVIVNGENSSAQGRGITPRIAKDFRDNGVDIITSGNHIWFKKDIYAYLNEHNDLLRPANYPSQVPGQGVATFECGTFTIAVINLQGRIFMREHVEDPLRKAESILTYLKSKTNIIVVDFHAEATSEKMALAHYLDGSVSAIVGTHTHVQTADERILPKGTAFITDIGMVGALNGMLGMNKEPVMTNFLTQLPSRFFVDTQPPFVMSGAVITVDTDTGNAVEIYRIRIIDHEPINDSFDAAG